MVRPLAVSSTAMLMLDAILHSPSFVRLHSQLTFGQKEVLLSAPPAFSGICTPGEEEDGQTLRGLGCETRFCRVDAKSIGGSPRFSFDQGRIAEFMRAIPVSLEFNFCALQHIFVRKRTQQPVMTRVRLVDSREQRIDHSQAARRIDALRGKAFPSMHQSIPGSG